MADFKKKIHRVFEYIFYRTYGYYYEKGGDTSGTIVFAVPFNFLFLSISDIFSTFVFHIWTTRIYALVVSIIALILIEILSRKLNAEAKYLSLKKKYRFKEEPHRKLKGWLVFLYYICSFLIYLFSLYVSMKHLT